MTAFRSWNILRHIGVLLALLFLIAGSSTNLSRAQDTDSKLSEAEVEQLVAPIALHPDALVSQILMASTYPLEVVEAQRWVKSNPNVSGKALEDAMEKQAWDPSVKSLAAFPQVLDMMSDELSWTQQLGDAFLAQQDDVLGAVQALRARADKAGNLKTTKEQKVEKQAVTSTSGAKETVIVVEQSYPEVVYVPSYDPTVVYGSWSWPDYPPYYWYPPGYVAGRVFWFAAGVAAGNALWGHCDWGRRDVDIDINRYNNFNRTNITNKEWTHNSVHRKGVPYRDQNVAERFGKGRDRAQIDAREKFRGHADSARRDLASVKPEGIKKPDLGGRKPDLSGKLPNVSGKKPDLSARKPAIDKSAAKAKIAARPAVTKPAQFSRPAKTPAAFKDIGNARQVQRHAARGRASHAIARGGGGHRGGGRRR